MAGHLVHHAPTRSPLRLADALTEAAARLYAAGIETPRLEAELLGGHALGLARAQVMAAGDRALTNDQLRRLDGLLARRLAHEPLPYILGQWEFFGLAFHTDARALIPRPETEHLVERALGFVGSLAMDAPIICDVGTGSGCIAITLACHLPHARLLAIDLSADALALAAANARRHRVHERITFRHGDLLEPLTAQAHVITANLPYVATAELATLAPEVACHEPRLALDGGPDGLDAIRRLLAQAPAKLRAGGLLLLEVGAGQAAQVMALARAAFPHAATDTLYDYAGHARIVQVQT